TMNLIVFDPDYSISPTSLDFGYVAVGETTTTSVVLSNAGSTVQVGTVGAPNGLVAPFSIVSDDCSDATLASEESCTIEIQFAPTGADDFEDTFNIPLLAPHTTSEVISLEATSILPDEDLDGVGDSVDT